jgi:hypothetical protein
MKLVLATVAIALAVTGCAKTTLVFDRPGATQADYHAEMAACEYEAEKATAAIDWRITSVTVAKQRLVVSCMKSKGWTMTTRQENT